jgi:hypothetical protein
MLTPIYISNIFYVMPKAVLSFANSVGLARIMSVNDIGFAISIVVGGFGFVNCPLA